MATHRYGQIVVVPGMLDPNGVNPKDRPAVIVTPTDEITETDSVEVVAITTLLPGPLPADSVRLPWHRSGHPRTGLKTNCAAMCSWIAEADPSQIRALGVVPAAQMLEIARKLAELRGMR
jgi:mRNA-degrading endonuclease toxin of MazEF toxin-antitoxin module